MTALTGVKQAVFLDRDGVINARPAAEKRYITRWQEFRFLPGALAALRQLKRSGRKVLILSNQAGVGRRIYSAARLREITRKMLQKIRAAGGRVDAVYYCTHTPQAGCACRKPRPGLLLRAARRFSIDPRRSFLIGDNASDVQLGRAAGCRTVLVLTGVTSRSQARRVSPRPHHIARDLRTAVRWILRQPA